ncbi:hypothetical protein AQF52_4694 [Streptomyces venezuelae]|uniref:hypothetical protein n=1 Tax=Streptomyces gardneri TaxID=66892 RepID=UPI0006BCB2DE|nr:hypothetical protein [Streptomyces gardneri]ALO10288.1 hypothetical protein AQF52_4694 [Streptomyces venezuelae]QPK47306.1 hypothetical protein H4W23_23545 [Streptomyces gardneri]WRK38730.1 hypothetical protein U0M97_23645 [Streptomyces venezuelae]CUM39252.1 hypothetical protein BN2537_7469 [Streptomyces venezuelae]
MENNDNTDLLRDAMDRTVDVLPPLPDLAPLAVREGRRRRARARFAVGAAAFGVLTVGALGLTLLPSPGTDVAGVATHTVGEAERERRAEYQRRMAALLDERLPETITEVRPVQGDVEEYRITAGGETFRMVVSVQPEADWITRLCAPACEDDTRLRRGPTSEWPTIRSTVQYYYRKSVASFTVYAGKAVVPVTARDIFTVAKDPRFLELVKEADARPMEPPLGKPTDPPLPPLDGPGTDLGTGSGTAQRAR